MIRRIHRRRAALGAAFAFAALTVHPALAAEGRDATALKVCQDAANLPFSDGAGNGYENKIADLFAADLKVPVKYFSFPNRIAFVRNTLRYKLPDQPYRCDIIIGVPVGFDQVSATKPYYASTFALVFPKGHGMDNVHSGADFLALGRDRLNKLKIGVIDQTPASLWMAKHNLVDQGVPYLGNTPDTDHSPTYLLQQDLIAHKVDVAILWGPIAGYMSKTNPDMIVVPLQSEPGVTLDYAMAMGVRYGEPQWKATVQGLIDRHRADIDAILKDYNVPVVPIPPPPHDEH